MDDLTENDIFLDAVDAVVASVLSQTGTTRMRGMRTSSDTSNWLNRSYGLLPDAALRQTGVRSLAKLKISTAGRYQVRLEGDGSEASPRARDFCSAPTTLTSLCVTPCRRRDRMWKGWMEANRLLNTAPEDLKQYLVEKYRVEPIRLLRDDWYAAHQEVQVDVRYDAMRWIDDKSRLVLVSGERIEVRVPFEGESKFFCSRPNTMSSDPPRRRAAEAG
jgi:hypothetical protein